MPRRDDYDDEDRYDDRDRDRDHDRDDDYDDYDDRPRRRGGRAAAAQKVSLPAIFLMIVGGLGFVLAIVNGAMILAGVDDGNPFAQNDPAMKDDPAYKIGQAIGGVLSIVWGLIVFLGGMKLKSLSSRGFVTFACVWAMIPCNACCILGIPFGIWALVAMNDESVKRAF